MAFWTPLVALLTLTLFYVTWYKNKKKSTYPPGPIPIPIFGTLWQSRKLREYPGKHLSEMRATYGDIVMTYLGSRRMVQLCSYKLIKEAFLDNNKYTDHRPVNFHSVQKVSKGRGVVNVNGPKQREMRKFAISAMRDFGVGRQGQEEKILEEVEFICQEIRVKEKKPTDPNEIFTKAVSNVIGNIIFGKRSNYDDPHFVWFSRCLDQLFAVSHLTAVENFLPWIRFFRTNPMLEKKVDVVQELQQYIMGRVEEHKKSYNKESPRDFIDLYIRETTENAKTSLTGPDLAHTILELYMAGTETTVTTLRWVLLYLATYPQVQEKCCKEIRNKVEAKERPNLSDRERLPYTGAVIKECMRLGNTAPATLLHETTCDITLGGYSVPKDTILIGNLSSVHLDEEIFPKAQEFNPDRWLDEDGTLIKKAEFIPFSLGRRDCLGEKLAKTEIFLFTTCLLQSFKFYFPDDTKPPSMEGVQRLTLQTEPYTLIFTEQQ